MAVRSLFYKSQFNGLLFQRDPEVVRHGSLTLGCIFVDRRIEHARQTIHAFDDQGGRAASIQRHPVVDAQRQHDIRELAEGGANTGFAAVHDDQVDPAAILIRPHGCARIHDRGIQSGNLLALRHQHSVA